MTTATSDNEGIGVGVLETLMQHGPKGRWVWGTHRKLASSFFKISLQEKSPREREVWFPLMACGVYQKAPFSQHALLSCPLSLSITVPQAWSGENHQNSELKAQGQDQPFCRVGEK
jgi:hypothetical protein